MSEWRRDPSCTREDASAAVETVRAFVNNLPAEGDAIAGYVLGGVRFELTGAALRTLLVRLAELDETLAGAGEEWGARVVYTSGKTFEDRVAATEIGASDVIAELDDDLNRPYVVSRELLVRTTYSPGPWRTPKKGS